MPPDYDKISCREGASGDAIILQVLVSLAVFFIDNAQEIALMHNQWVKNGIMVAGSIVALKTIHNVWPGLGTIVVSYPLFIYIFIS